MHFVVFSFYCTVAAVQWTWASSCGDTSSFSIINKKGELQRLKCLVYRDKFHSAEKTKQFQFLKL